MVSENDSNKKNSIHLRYPPNLALLLNQFNNTSAEQNDKNCRYLDKF